MLAKNAFIYASIVLIIHAAAHLRAADTQSQLIEQTIYYFKAKKTPTDTTPLSIQTATSKFSTCAERTETKNNIQYTLRYAHLTGTAQTHKALRKACKDTQNNIYYYWATGIPNAPSTYTPQQKFSELEATYDALIKAYKEAHATAITSLLAQASPEILYTQQDNQRAFVYTAPAIAAHVGPDECTIIQAHKNDTVTRWQGSSNTRALYDALATRYNK